MSEAVKTCMGCKEAKPLEAFSKDRRARDGLVSRCKVCARKRSREYYAANAEKVGERMREYYAANTEKVAERSREYREANREQLAERRREYYAANREHWAEYREANRGQIARRKRESLAGPRDAYRQRMRRYGFPIEVCDDFTRSDVVEAYGDGCWHCMQEGQAGPYEHLDHYPVPVSKAGPHSLENVRPSCAAHNLSRGDAADDRDAA